MKKRVGCLAVCLSGIIMLSISVSAVAESWRWNNLAYGGGGYISGLVFHPMEPGILYARTDVGGAYRWEQKKKRWTPITDSFSFAEWNLYGIDGLCVDPNNPDIIYIAAGKYYWNPCDVYKSIDRGTTWEKTNLNKGFYANGPYRGYGENIAVDPQDSNTVYVGTTTSGLFRSFDGAKNWEQVSDIHTNSDPAAGEQVRGIVFNGDKIYVSVINQGIYRGNKRMDTWELLPGSPPETRRMCVSQNTLYAAAASGVYKLENDRFYNITPPRTVIPWGAYGVDSDPADKNHVVCTVYTGNLMKYPVYRSTDGGMTWRDITAQMERNNTVPWWQKVYFSSNTSTVQMDPFNTKTLWIGDWFGVWTTEDAAVPVTQWNNPVGGIEEAVAFDAVSTVGQARLLTAVADNDGSRFTYLGRYPETMFGSPKLMSTTGIDVCRNNASFVVRTGVRHEEDGWGGYSCDNGKTWTPFTDFPKDAEGNPYKGGRIAVSADCGQNGIPTLLLLPVGAPAYRSVDLGQSWQKIEGLEAGIVSDYWNVDHPLAADGKNPDTFYVAQGGKLMASTDGGVTWDQRFLLLSEKISTVKTDYLGGVIILTNKGNVYVSGDGYSFGKINSLDSAAEIGMGKELISGQHETVYAYGQIGGKTGMFYSVDFCRTWTYMHFEHTIPGNQIYFIEGDARDFGIVYVGTDGRGIFVGTLVDGTALCENFETAVNWELENTMTVKDGKLTNSDWDGISKGIYRKTPIAGAFSLSCGILNGGSGTGNLARLLFHYADANNYYCLELGGGNGEIVLRKKADGVFSDISPRITCPAGQIHTAVRLVYDGDGQLWVYCRQGDGGEKCIFAGIICETVPYGFVGVESEKTNAWYDHFYLDNSSIITAQKEAVKTENGIRRDFWVFPNTNTAMDVQAYFVEREGNRILKNEIHKDFSKKIMTFNTTENPDQTSELMIWNGMHPMCPKLIMR